MRMRVWNTCIVGEKGDKRNLTSYYSYYIGGRPYEIIQERY